MNCVPGVAHSPGTPLRLRWDAEPRRFRCVASLASGAAPSTASSTCVPGSTCCSVECSFWNTLMSARSSSRELRSAVCRSEFMSNATTSAARGGAPNGIVTSASGAVDSSHVTNPGTPMCGTARLVVWEGRRGRCDECNEGVGVSVSSWRVESSMAVGDGGGGGGAAGPLAATGHPLDLRHAPPGFSSFPRLVKQALQDGQSRGVTRTNASILLGYTMLVNVTQWPPPHPRSTHTHTHTRPTTAPMPPPAESVRSLSCCPSPAGARPRGTRGERGAPRACSSCTRPRPRRQCPP